MSTSALPRQLRVSIEVSKGSHIKRGSDGEFEFLSPLPCPWNYGSAIGHLGEDGDPIDVVVMGKMLEPGAVVEVELRGRIPFTDQGLQDDKWIASATVLSRAKIEQLESFFTRYARAKRWAGRLRLRSGSTEAGRFIPLD